MVIYIKKSPGKGLGVFAGKEFDEGEIIEVCPVYILHENECDIIDQSSLLNYYYLWGEDDEKYAICWGYGSLYNHSHEPNASFVRDFDNGRITFIAERTIAKDEEILIDYEWEMDEDTPEWFNAASHRKAQRT